MSKQNMNFLLNKFARFFLIGLSAIILFAVSQQASIDLTKSGPQSVLALDDNCLNSSNDGCPEVGNSWDIPAAPVQEPAVPQIPAQPVNQPIAATPSCNDDVRYCDANVGKNIHKTGGYWDGGKCVYAFVQEDSCGQSAPAPQPAPQQSAPQGGRQACSPGGWSAVSCSVCNAQGTGMNANGSDWGTYDGRWGSWCGCAQKFSNINNFPQCGNPAPVQAPAPVVQAPAQPAAAPAQPAPAPVQNHVNQLPQCDTLANNSVCGQKAYDTCREFTQNGIKYFDCVASQNHNCTGIIQCSVPSAPVPAAPAAPVVNNVAPVQAQRNQQAQQVTQAQTVNAVGGPSTATGGTSIVTITGLSAQSANPTTVLATNSVCPAGTVRVVQNQTVVCERVVNQYQPGVILAGAKELPKTGLPIVAWAIGALVPVGLKLRRFSNIKAGAENSPNYLWQKRQFLRS